MKLRFLKGRYAGRVVDLKEDGFSIGRGSDNDLRLDEEGISRHHCKFFVKGGVWYVQDLGSTNGVRVNGDLIGEARALEAGGRIGLFNQTFLLTEEADIVEPPVTGGGGARSSDTVDVAPSKVPAPAPSRDADPKMAGLPEPAATPPAKPADGDGGEPEDEGGFPWGHAVLLIVLVLVLGWVFWNTVRSPQGGSSEGEGTQETEEVTGADVVTPEVDGVSPDSPGVDGADDLFQPDDAAPEGEPDAAVDMPGPGNDERGTPPRDDPAPAPPVAFILATTPAGATAKIDDRIVGQTPVGVNGLPPGRHILAFSKDGYEELVRQILIPGMVPDRPFELRLEAGAVLVTSDPSGASVIHGTQMLGQTPLVVDSLPEGLQTVRVLCSGYDARKQEVMVGKVKGETVHVVLEPQFGSLELITLPAGCDVYVDRVLKGRTVRDEQAERYQSQPFRVNGLIEGEHLIRAEHPNGGERENVVTIQRTRVTPLAIRMWVLDTKVTLKDGTEKHGMLLSINEYGDVILAEPRTNRYLKLQVEKIEPLTPAAAREILQQREEPKPGKETAPPARPEAPREEPVSWLDQPVGGEAGQDDLANGQQTPLAVTVDELKFKLEHESGTAVSRMYGGKTVTLTGVPTSSRGNAVRGELQFGSAIRCEFSADLYERTRDQIKAAQADGGLVKVTGRALVNAQRLELRDCQLSFPEPEEDGD